MNSNKLDYDNDPINSFVNELRLFGELDKVGDNKNELSASLNCKCGNNGILEGELYNGKPIKAAFCRDQIDEVKDMGEVSDGYHTFNELYYHRMVLSAWIFNSYSNIIGICTPWKSKLHHDGTMYDGMFIVGMDTPYGQVSYHYDLEHWDLFRVKELDRAPEWDGHTPTQAIERIRRIVEDFIS